MVTWTDAEFGGTVKHATEEEPRKAAPTGGGIIMVGTMPVMWFSKKLKNALSTGDAELQAAVQAVRDTKHLMLVMGQMRVQSR